MSIELIKKTPKTNQFVGDIRPLDIPKGGINKSPELDTLNNEISAGKLFQQEKEGVMKRFIAKTSENSFEVNFLNNTSAERNIGLADVLDNDIRKVRITGERHGKTIELTGVRQGLKGGFYTEDGKYLPIFHGFKIEILERYTEEQKTAQIKIFDEKTTEILHSPTVQVFKDSFSENEMIMIVKKAQEYGIDPTFVLALRKTESGKSGIEFGVMKKDVDTFEGQLTFACRIIQNNMNRYRMRTQKNPLDSDGHFTAEFIGRLSSVYAPIGASNDSNNPNQSHFGNLIALYGSYCGKKFGDIAILIKDRDTFNADWETKYGASEIIGKTDADSLVREAQLYNGTPYVWGGNSERGIDCSGLTIAAMQNTGVVEHCFDTTAAGLSHYTKAKNPHEVQKGDLIFKHGANGITHVEIATGPAQNGRIPIIHATRKGTDGGSVMDDYQTINENISAGTPIFYA